MARKLQNMPERGRKRIIKSDSRCTVTDRGHFVIYTRDHKRYAVPLPYLRTKIFQELLRMSEEEFGLSSDGPITLPCDAELLDLIFLLTQRGIANHSEKSCVSSIGINCCLYSVPSLWLIVKHTLPATPSLATD